MLGIITFTEIFQNIYYIDDTIMFLLMTDFIDRRF